MTALLYKGVWLFIQNKLAVEAACTFFFSSSTGISRRFVNSLGNPGPSDPVYLALCILCDSLEMNLALQKSIPESNRDVVGGVLYFCTTILRICTPYTHGR